MIRGARRWIVAALCIGAPLGSAASAGAAGPFETVVRARPDRAGPAQWTVAVEDAQNLAGGFGDPLRAIDAVPAVARAPLGSGALVVWGSAPTETRIVYLGMELPALYHFGGQRGILPAALMKDFTLSPAAFGSEYGRALGGLVSITPRAIPDGVHGTAAADLLDASASLSAALGSRVRVVAAGRYSYLDRVLGAIAATRLGDFFPLPAYYDAQAQASFRISSQAELRATFLTSGDAVTRAHATGDAERAQTEAIQRSFYRMGLQYQHEQRGDQRTRLELTPWLGIDRQRYEAAFGGTPALQKEDTLLYGLRASYEIGAVRSRVLSAVRVGLDLLGSRAELARTGTLTRPPREGDRAVFGQRPGFEINADTWSTHVVDLALHAALVLRHRSLRVEPGLRIGGTSIDGSRLLPPIGAAPPLGSREIFFAAEPRLLVRAQPLTQLAIVLAGGLHHQPPASTELSAVFGNPKLGLQRAVHGSAALEVTLRELVRIELAAYVRWLDRLVARSTLATPPLAAALTQDGSGYGYGGHLLLRLDSWRFRRGSVGGWASYAVSRSLRRDAVVLPLRLFGFDQTHGLQAALQARVIGIGASLRLRYATGLPRTAVIGSYYNALADQYEPRFGPLYGTRLPDFVQLDLRFDYTFSVGGRARIGVQLEVQNLTHRQNAEELVYNHDYSQAEYITGLPTLGVLNVRLEF